MSGLACTRLHSINAVCLAWYRGSQGSRRRGKGCSLLFSNGAEGEIRIPAFAQD